MLSLGRISYLTRRYVLVRNIARSNSVHHASILNLIMQTLEASHSIDINRRGLGREHALEGMRMAGVPEE